MTTPYARVAAYLDARAGNPQRPDVISWAVDATHAEAQLLASDLAALLAEYVERCEEHQACEECETPLCRECGVGEFSGCEERVLCATCVFDVCRDCARDAWEGEQADIAYALSKERA